MKRTALLSVYNKDGIIDFARDLIELDFDILASGGTAKVLSEAGLPVVNVATTVGDPILGHRVVTLSREIHAGLLARDNYADRQELQKLGIRFIDLVCCDLYPLKQAIANPNATLESVLEKTDIGGRAMLLAAAKGRRIVITDFADRKIVIDHLNNFSNNDKLISMLAARAEFRVAEYCLRSANYLSGNFYQGILTDHTPMLNGDSAINIAVAKLS